MALAELTAICHGHGDGIPRLQASSHKHTRYKHIPARVSRDKRREVLGKSVSPIRELSNNPHKRGVDLRREGWSWKFMPPLPGVTPRDIRELRVLLGPIKHVPTDDFVVRF